MQGLEPNLKSVKEKRLKIKLKSTQISWTDNQNYGCANKTVRAEPDCNQKTKPVFTRTGLKKITTLFWKTSSVNRIVFTKPVWLTELVFTWIIFFKKRQSGTSSVLRTGLKLVQNQFSKPVQLFKYKTESVKMIQNQFGLVFLPNRFLHNQSDLCYFNGLCLAQLHDNFSSDIVQDALSYISSPHWSILNAI